VHRLQVKRGIQAAENIRILVYGLSTARQGHSSIQTTERYLARNAVDEESGYLRRHRYVLHDRDTKFCADSETPWQAEV
jgi:hypothetical protein